MVSIAQVGKPTQAGWVAKVTLNPHGDAQAAPAPAGMAEHAFEQVEIAWYGDDRVKVTFKDAGPALVRQMYLTGAGRDVILDVIADR